MKTHTPVEEKILSPRTNGLAFLLLNTLAIILSIAAMVIAFVLLVPSPVMVILIVVTMLYAFLVGPLLYIGLKIVKPNEAIVLTLFGRYMGTIKEEGFYWVHPFATAVCPVSASDFSPSSGKTELKRDLSKSSGNITVQLPKRKISLKATTLNNDKQKVNDALGNPIIIGVVVVWRVVNTAFAVFNVENYIEYLSIQCDAALRNVVRHYPYDSDDDENSLRGSSSEVAQKLSEELQQRVLPAGLEVMEARITHLSYAPEIAAAMLQRQQATAIIAARQKIVEGAVGMVEMALTQLNDNDLVTLDEERKANMVSNLLVVLCGNRDVQPIVNSGSLY
ncbi:MAG: SPFH domain-containing protein [Sphaerochaeta sp.]|nr:SPFH domain-containing protein [Sphaerochaeta sp.]